MSLLLVVGVARGGTDGVSSALAATPSGAGGEDTQPLWAWPEFDDERFMVRGQTTYAWSRKFAFDAPYTGPQSLVTHPESSYTLSFTAYLGARLWQGGELYANPEAFQAQPLSNLFGLAGIQNGELQKASGPELRAYFARLFLRQSFGLGGRSVKVPAGLNQLATRYERRRLVFTLGKGVPGELHPRATERCDVGSLIVPLMGKQRPDDASILVRKRNGLDHARLGDQERALAQLEEAYRNRELSLTEVAIEPAFDSIRTERRFGKVLRCVGLSKLR